MTSHAVLPEIGQVFRSIITGAGFRPRLVELGLDKDLDDLALGSRPSSSADLLLGLENRIQQDLATDCGARWAQLLRWQWSQTREVLQQLAREVETTPMAVESGASVVRAGFTVPWLAWVMRFAAQDFPGIDVELWWRSPIEAWVKLVASIAMVDEAEVIDRLHHTPRTTERWMAGDPVRELRFPYRDSVRRCLSEYINRCSVEQIDSLAGWLTLAVSYQSISVDLRADVRLSYEIDPRQPWSPNAFIADLQRKGHDAGPRDLWVKAEPMGMQIAVGLNAEQRNFDHVEALLRDYKLLIDAECERSGLSYQYIHDYLCAGLAARVGKREEALKLYASAVTGMWWRGGRNQEPILNEALLYAVGVGDVESAKRYWDKTFLLGLNRWPKRELDEQERRRLAFAFEQVFAPQLAHDRIPPKVEVIVREEPFELTSKQLKNPNAKVKHAAGRTRRTPLMDAIRDGTLNDVKQAIAAGGDPNDCWRRPKFDPPCRLNFDPGLGAGIG